MLNLLNILFAGMPASFPVHGFLYAAACGWFLLERARACGLNTLIKVKPAPSDTVTDIYPVMRCLGC